MHNTNDNANDLDRYMDIVSEFSATIRNERADVARLEAEAERIKSDETNRDKHNCITGEAKTRIGEIKLNQMTIQKRINHIKSEKQSFDIAIIRIERRIKNGN